MKSWRNGKAAQFLASKANLFWVTVAVLVMVLHVTLHRFFPELNPPATPNKPNWVRGWIYGEAVVHWLVMAATCIALWNSVPGLKNPSYSDAGTLSLNSTVTPEPGIRWTEIGLVVAEFALYLTIWAWIYRII